MSFRLKTILGIALMQAVVMALLVWLATYYMDSWMLEAVDRRANDTSRLFATMSKDALISTDLATLEEMVAEVAALQEVAYVEVSDSNGVLASRGEVTAADQGAVLAVAAGVEEAGYSFGKIRLGFDTTFLLQRLDEARWQLSLIALVGMGLLLLASWFLGAHLTQQLVRLQSHAKAVASGETREELEVHGNDELAVTARAFNSMLNSLKTEQKKLSAKAHEAQVLGELNARGEIYLRTVLESVVDSIITIENDGVISRVNPATEELFGYDADELLGRNVAILMADTDKNHFSGYSVRDIAALSSDYLGKGREIKAVRKDGSAFPIDISVSIMRLEGRDVCVSMIRDLTLKQKMEAEVRRSGRIKSMVADASLDALVTINLQGLVVEYNAAAEALFGWSREEMMGQLMEDYLIPPEMRQMHSKGMAHFIETGEGPLVGKRIEVEAMSADGQRIPIEFSLVAAAIDGDWHATAFMRDIRGRLEAEQQLVQAKEDAEQASHAKSRFLSHMSHEIRSPLNAVLAAVHLVAERVEDTEQRHLLHTAQSSGAALLAVINEVLDFSKIESGHLDLVHGEHNLTELVEEVLGAAQTRMRTSGVELLASIGASAQGRLVTDPVRLRQIINILVDNARKFTTQGIIEVRAERSKSADDKDLLCIRVSDTGVGIPLEHQASIFDEFEQAESGREADHGGTGLGLTIASRLVGLLEGSIGVTSAPGRGSCFQVAIPVVFKDAEPVVRKLDPQLNLVLVSSNTVFQDVFATRLGSWVKSLVGVASLKELHRKLDSFDDEERAQTRIMIDESLLQQLGALNLPGWLVSWPTPVAILTRPEVRWPATLSSDAYRLVKPISCSRVYAYLNGDGMPEMVSPVVEGKLSGRVLLVEDIEANRLVATELMSRRGLEVEIACDGLEALEKAQDSLFDVILMDVRMPYMNGIEAVERLRSGDGVNADTPIIALTANAEKSEIDRCFAAGMNDFISKPFDVERLLGLLAEFCSRDEAADTQAPNDVAEPDGAELDLLDREVITRLERDTSAEIVLVMLDAFIVELGQRRSDVAQATLDQDQVLLAESAHALKGCSATFGARELQQSAGKLEALCIQPDAFDEVMQLAPRVLNLLDHTFKEYRSLREHYRTGTSDTAIGQEKIL
uniref:PAS domain S-box protein n=1 Tax=Marinobacterium profundum TaxID=1714300 RepID=UPI000833AC8D|nr:PAS domain S-box protein [Marinobacterium profundum]